MSSLAQQEEAAVLSEINVTPFTDVLLVLLIIFMILASLALPPGFEREFSPCACDAIPHTPPKQIPVTVNHAGRIFVDGQSVSAAGLYPLLARLHARAPRDNVALYADVAAPYGLVIRVLDAAKAAGIGDVSFFTS